MNRMNFVLVVGVICGWRYFHPSCPCISDKWSCFWQVKLKIHLLLIFRPFYWVWENGIEHKVCFCMVTSEKLMKWSHYSGVMNGCFWYRNIMYVSLNIIIIWSVQLSAVDYCVYYTFFMPFTIYVVEGDTYAYTLYSRSLIGLNDNIMSCVAEMEVYLSSSNLLRSIRPPVSIRNASCKTIFN